MKQKETLLNIRLNGDKIELSDILIDEIGDNHVSTSVDTPMRDDAFTKTDAEKIAEIETHFHAIMETLGLDLNDDSLKGTPHRVAKMYVQEIFSGLNPANKPDIALFENNTNTMRCLLKRIFLFTAIASIILYPLLVKPI